MKVNLGDCEWIECLQNRSDAGVADTLTEFPLLIPFTLKEDLLNIYSPYVLLVLAIFKFDAVS